VLEHFVCHDSVEFNLINEIKESASKINSNQSVKFETRN
jgi:hypothetical protein